MSSNTPKPLTPPDCDLRDFSFMPLDVVRLRDSDMALTQTPESCWAAVLLWCASWHQIPAASLPDDDRILSNLAGYGRVVKEWKKVKTGAMHGWVKCSDGRLYHKVVAEKAGDAWDGKLRQRWMTECARIKKHAERHKLDLIAPSFEEWKAASRPAGHALPTTAADPKEQGGNADIKPQDTNCPDPVPKTEGHCPDDVPETGPNCPDDVPNENGSKGQGKGQGQGQGQEYKEEETPLTPQGGAPDDAEGGEIFPALDDQDLVAGLVGSTTLEDQISELPPSAGSACTTVGAACLAMKAAGIPDTASGNPKLRALIDAGAELSEFLSAAQTAVASGNARFKYVLGIVAGERQRAAELVQQLRVPPLSSGQSSDRPAQRPHNNKQTALERSNKGVADDWIAEQQALLQQGVTA